MFNVVFAVNGIAQVCDTPVARSGFLVHLCLQILLSLARRGTCTRLWDEKSKNQIKKLTAFPGAAGKLYSRFYLQVPASDVNEGSGPCAEAIHSVHKKQEKTEILTLDEDGSKMGLAQQGQVNAPRSLLFVTDRGPGF